ncbi:MAG: hypothetical protein JRN15_04100 [Nitrososphaerota archaeon]|nr:hypothetical protein [Nitrososphaerota archaeon]
MNVPALFRITSLAVFIQIALGGLVTFEVLPFKVSNFDLVTLLHVINGIVVFILVVVAATAALRSKPSHKGLSELSGAMIIVLILQVTIGLTMVAVIDSAVLSWIHLLIGVLIYAMTLVGRSFAMLRDQAAGIK